MIRALNRGGVPFHSKNYLGIISGSTGRGDGDHFGIDLGIISGAVQLGFLSNAHTDDPASYAS